MLPYFSLFYLVISTHIQTLFCGNVFVICLSIVFVLHTILFNILLFLPAINDLKVDKRIIEIAKQSLAKEKDENERKNASKRDQIGRANVVGQTLLFSIFFQFW